MLLRSSGTRFVVVDVHQLWPRMIERNRYRLTAEGFYSAASAKIVICSMHALRREFAIDSADSQGFTPAVLSNRQSVAVEHSNDHDLLSKLKDSHLRFRCPGNVDPRGGSAHIDRSSPRLSKGP